MRKYTCDMVTYRFSHARTVQRSVKSKSTTWQSITRRFSVTSIQKATYKNSKKIYDCPQWETNSSHDPRFISTTKPRSLRLFVVYNMYYYSSMCLVRSPGRQRSVCTVFYCPQQHGIAVPLSQFQSSSLRIDWIFLQSRVVHFFRRKKCD